MRLAISILVVLNQVILKKVTNSHDLLNNKNEFYVPKNIRDKKSLYFNFKDGDYERIFFP